MRNAQVTQTITTQIGTYAASDCIGGLQTLIAFNTPPGAAGFIDDVMLISKSGNTIAATAYFFDSNPVNSSFPDKGTISISPLDLSKLTIPPITLTGTIPQGGTFSVASSSPQHSTANADVPPTANLYVAIVSNGNIVPAGTSDLILTLGLSVN
jgi:hypothetical protein